MGREFLYWGGEFFYVGGEFFHVGGELLVTEGLLMRGKGRGRSSEAIIDESIRFIEENKDKPFYVNVWLIDYIFKHLC